jgi:hypothetical protein
VVALALLVKLLAGPTNARTSEVLVFVSAIAVFLLAIVLIYVVKSKAYVATERTKLAADALELILSSSQGYCLLLRPFGHDGFVRLPIGYYPFWVPRSLYAHTTIEQVIVQAVEGSLRLRTYAIIDQAQPVAPPGPVFLRAAPDEWKPAAEKLIERANLIVIFLPATKGLRAGLDWELRQIAQHPFRGRILIVLAPPRSALGQTTDHLYRAAEVIALLRMYFGAADDAAGPLAIEMWHKKLVDRRAIVIEVCTVNSIADRRRVEVRAWPAAKVARARGYRKLLERVMESEFTKNSG